MNEQNIESQNNTAPSSSEQSARLDREIAELKGKMGVGDTAVDTSDLHSEDTYQEKNEPLLGKFKSVEELEKAYQQLEAKLGDPNAQAESEEDGSEPVSKESEESKEEGASHIPNVSVQELTDLSNRWSQSGGKLEDSDYSMLAEKGYPKEVVDAYIRGVQIRTDSFFEHAGGKEQFSQMGEWARKNLPAEEVANLNRHLASQNDADVYMALDHLKSKYERANPAKPNLIKGKTPSTGSTDVYKSNAEVMKDMRDPRYKSGTKSYDPAFVKHVRQKLIRSQDLLK